MSTTTTTTSLLQRYSDLPSPLYLIRIGVSKFMNESFGGRERHYESHKVLRRNLLQFLHREELRDLPKKKAQILETPNKAYP